MTICYIHYSTYFDMNKYMIGFNLRIIDLIGLFTIHEIMRFKYEQKYVINNMILNKMNIEKI